MHKSSVGIVLVLLGVAGVVAGAEPTRKVSVQNPAKVNLVFNRSAVRDAANSSVTAETVFSPTGNPYTQFNPAGTGTYAIRVGRNYDVGAIEFVWGRYLNNNFVPGTFGLYVAASNVANLYQAQYKVADQTTLGLVNSDRSPASDGEGYFQYQQIRYDLPVPQSVCMIGMQVTGWQALGGGGDARAFLLAASAFPRNAALDFDGEIGIFSHTWAPGGSMTATATEGGAINSTPVYDTDAWASPRWYARPWESGGGEIDITIHLIDNFKLTGMRWAAAQSWPVDYQIFAADKATTPSGGDWVPATTNIHFAGAGNQGTRVDFNTQVEGNWLQVRRTVTGPAGYWVNTKWQVYGEVIPPGDY